MRLATRACQWLLLLTLLHAGGCTALLIGGAVVAGAGTVAYVKGELKSTEEVPFETAWAATDESVEELGLARVSDAHDDTAGAIIARDASDDKVTIKVARLDDERTQISIRVGLFGDEAQSNRILSEIRERYETVAVSLVYE